MANAGAASDPASTLIDQAIEDYFDSLGSTLFGKYFTLTEPDTRAAAHAWVVDLLTKVGEALLTKVGDALHERVERG